MVYAISAQGWLAASIALNHDHPFDEGFIRSLIYRQFHLLRVSGRHGHHSVIETADCDPPSSNPYSEQPHQAYETIA